jgi:tetratricopeptide (TPR) repeat protein
VAANRQIEPGKLGRFVKGELDWIVLKALSKERDRRYETANGFARDIERFLSHEPVQAGPPSAAYKFRKFVQRNRGQVIAAGLVSLSLLAGILGTTWGMVKANRSAELERIAKEDANRKHAEAKEQQLRAENAEKQLLDDYRAATDDAVERLIGARSELGPEETQYLQNSLARWQAYAQRQGDDAKSRTIRGEGHYRVAALYTKLNQRGKAESEYQIARAVQKSLVDEFPEEPTYQYDLARTHFSLANILASLSKPQEQILAMQEALDIQERLVKEHPAETKYQDFLATILNNFTDILEHDSPEIGLGHIRSALQIRQKLVQKFPDDPKQTEGLMLISLNTGDTLFALNRTDEAWEEYQRSLALAEQLVNGDPQNTLYLARLARVREKRARVLTKSRKLREALAEAEAAVGYWQRSVNRSPIWSNNRHGLGLSLVLVGDLRFRLLEFEEALTAFQKAQSIYTILVELFPSRSIYKWYLDFCHAQMARAYTALEQPEESLRQIRTGLDVLQHVIDQQPTDKSLRRSLAERYAQMAGVHSKLKQPSEALAAFQAALEQWQSLARQYPTDLNCRLQAAYFKAKVGRFDEAMQETEAMIQIKGWTADQRYQWACIYALAAGGSPTKREEYAERAMTLLKDAINTGRDLLDLNSLKTDKDLDYLRDRNDFQQLIYELEKTAGDQ